MSHLLDRSLRTTLALVASSAVLAALVAACLSSGGGSIGDACQSSLDCHNQFECLGIDDAGTCSTNGALTCQQACSAPANCLIIGTNYTCTPLKCAGPGNTGVCTAL